MNFPDWSENILILVDVAYALICRSPSSCKEKLNQGWMQEAGISTFDIYSIRNTKCVGPQKPHLICPDF